MTYDQHGTWSGPGPIGALAWQRRAVGVVTSMVPAAKVDLGVAGYGYTWPRDRDGRTVTDKQARKLVARDGAKARWRKGPGEWTARLSDGTRMWWSDGRPTCCASRWPASWGCTASRCGGWARPTRCPDPQSRAT